MYIFVYTVIILLVPYDSPSEISANVHVIAIVILLFFSGLKHPFGITMLDRDLYWTDWITRSVSKANLNGENQVVLKSELPGIMDVCVFAKSRQTGTFVMLLHCTSRVVRELMLYVSRE